ncbi:MAG: AI-2E family transporter [Coriobacteriia bacterium]|nr:AI-2E family transporter [Coriobacteriia bacterium]
MQSVQLKQILLLAALVLVICLTVLCWPEISGFLGLVYTGFVPIIVGFAFAYILNIPMHFIERQIDRTNPSPRMQALKRPLSLTLTIIGFILTAGIIVLLIVPQFAEAIILLQQHIPEYVDALRGQLGSEFFDSIRGLIASSTGIEMGADGNPQNAIDVLSNAGGFIGGLVSGIAGFASSAVSIVMSALMSVALLAEKETFRSFGLNVSHTYLGERRTQGIVHVLSVFDRTFHGFIVKQVADALVLGILVAVFMLIFGLPYASAVATLVGLSALIPLIGVYIGLALGALLVFAYSPILTIAFAVVTFILIQVEASFISPRITESALGIPGIWVLICITAFGAIWGILGILVGVPTFAALYHLLQEDIEKRSLPARVTSEE